MHHDLFLAILAMDSYNRGYGQGVRFRAADSSAGQNEIGRMLGNARIVAQNITGSAQSTGFYAIAYDWNGERIISYRGTNPIATSVDGFLNSPLVKDAWNGWRLGAGVPIGGQPALARNPLPHFA